MTMSVVERARADLARGEPWLARDRLRGAIKQRPTDQDVIRALAATYTTMGDLPAGGAWWFLSERPDDDPDAAAGLVAFRDRRRGPVALANALPIRRPATDYPPAAQHRISALQDELTTLHYSWTPPSPPLRMRPAGVQPSRTSVRTRLWDTAEIALVTLLVLGNLGLYLLGLVTLLRWIW
jgi:hypothetical protein